MKKVSRKSVRVNMLDMIRFKVISIISVESEKKKKIKVVLSLYDVVLTDQY